MSDEIKADKELERVKKAIDDLGEYFDAVMVFATFKNPDGSTSWVSKGIGCHFTRRGVVREWMLREDGVTRINARRNEHP